MTRCELDVPPLDARLLRAGPHPALHGWRCERCARLSLGLRDVCPFCGGRDGRETQLSSVATLETWTRVAATPPYVVAYGRLGDGEDDQTVVVLGPVDVVDGDESGLFAGQRLDVRFSCSALPSGERIHHRFVPDSGAFA